MIRRAFAELQRDAAILMISRGVRAFAFSYLGVVFTIYLSQLGYSTVTIGVVVTTAYASAAVLTAVWGYLSDRYGRKNILVLLAALTIVSNLIYIFSSHLIFIIAAVIIANVGAGGSGAGGQGGGPMSPVEQALLAEKCSPENRNASFFRQCVCRLDDGRARRALERLAAVSAGSVGMAGDPIVQAAVRLDDLLQYYFDLCLFAHRGTPRAEEAREKAARDQGK